MKLTYIVLVVFFIAGMSELKACEYTETEYDLDRVYKMMGVK